MQLHSLKNHRRHLKCLRIINLRNGTRPCVDVSLIVGRVVWGSGAHAFWLEGISRLQDRMTFGLHVASGTG